MERKTGTVTSLVTKKYNSAGLDNVMVVESVESICGDNGLGAGV